MGGYYEYEGDKFVIVDNAYSEEYGVVGKTDPFTGEPLPDEETDSSLYMDYTLEEIYGEWWKPPEERPALPHKKSIMVWMKGMQRKSQDSKQSSQSLDY